MENNEINLEVLEKFNDLVNHKSIISKRMITNNKHNKRYSYQIWNQVCTCIIRIRETSKYLNQLTLIRENVCGEAFSFYEFINLESIVFECVNSLFEIFGEEIKLEKAYGKNKSFKRSNQTRISDIKFFKFVRSASSVHPNNTTRYNNITKLKHEFYPYALWNDGKDITMSFKNISSEFDVRLVSWNSNPRCHYKEYYLYLIEFFEFINKIINCINFLFPKINKMIDDYKEKNRCKKLKYRRDFKTRSEYCLYLRKKLLVKNTNTEFADGGLLMASHILSNKILNNNFKNYIYRKVEKIAIQMTKDIEKIGFDDVCQDLEMFRINNKFGCNDYYYICEKFHDYLYHEAKNEIENNIFYDFHVSFRNESHNTNYSNAEWSIRLLNKLHNFYTKEDLINAKTFVDMYEITLQRIWFYLNEQEERL